MLNRVDKILIGKDISRTANVATSTDFRTLLVNLVSGEIAVLDKWKKYLVAGSTCSDSDIIYIVQGLADTTTVTNEAGTDYIIRKVLVSDAIEAAKVKKYEKEAYSAKSEQTAVVDFTDWDPVVGTEYIVRVIHKDVVEHPGQFVHEYRHVAKSVTLDDECALIVTKINSHAGRRVTASYNAGTDELTLTARPIEDCTTSVNDIDKFSMVDFKVRFLYVTSTGAWATIPSTVTTVTYSGPSYGSGNWEQIRDLEKAQLPYVGITNFTHFPVIKPDFSTVKATTYQLIVIEHDKSYLSPDNSYVKQTPLTTVVAIPVESSGTQLTTVLSQLNPWMASCPGAFGGLAF